MALRDAYLAKALADPKNDPVAPQAIRDHFDRMNTTLRNLEKERADAEPKHLEALLRFAERAYRRPLTEDERADLLAYYHTLRTKNELSHEDAIRDSVVSVLMSPDFLYRLDLPMPDTAPSKPLVRRTALQTAASFGSQPLSDYALASRLSYFLWSSMPDDELLRHAAAGDLQKTGRSAGANPAHAEGSSRARAGDRIHRQLAQFPPIRDEQFGRSRALSQLQRRFARGDVSGTNPLHGRRDFE